MKNIAIHARQNLKKPAVVRMILDELQTFAQSVSLTPFAREYVEGDFPAVDFSRRYDLFVIVGGDGSVLHAVGKMKNHATPILPVSAGTLGFLAEIPPERFAEACRLLLAGDFTLDYRALLDVVFVPETGEPKLFHALNDAVISQSSVARMVAIRTLVNGEYLTTYRADGLIVSTPTGSTAYSLSAGGPIVYPRLDAVILTPVSPHTLAHRSLVLPSDKEIEVMTDNESRENLMLTIDGQTAIPLLRNDRVRIKIGSEKIAFIRLPDEHFFKTISRKMHWGRE